MGPISYLSNVKIIEAILNQDFKNLIFYRMVKRGCSGDATVLKPTVMAAVPLMLDRIYKAIQEKVRKGSPTSQKLFFWAYQYRLEAMKRGESTPILDRIVFKKIRALLGTYFMIY